MNSAYSAANDTIGIVRSIVNKILFDRYELPALDVGVGLAVSRTLVTLVGLYPEKQPKAFGECVFRATKLSGGKNQVITDEQLKTMWPSSKGGTLRFTPKTIGSIKGYILNTAS